MKDLNKMIFLLLYFLCGAKSYFEESLNKLSLNSLLFTLPQMQVAKTEYELGIMEIEYLKYNYFPRLSLSCGGSISSSDSGIVNLLADPCISLNQQLPLGMSFSGSVSIPIHLPQLGNPSCSLQYGFAGSANLFIPFCGKELGRGVNDLLLNRFHLEKQFADMDYTLKTGRQVYDFAEKLWNYLYARELLEVLKKETALYLSLMNDSEKLLKTGKITVVEAQEQKNSWLRLVQEQYEKQKELTAYESSLFEDGITMQEIMISCENFLSWFENISGYYKAGEKIAIQQEKANLKRQQYSYYEQSLSRCNGISAGASMDESLNWSASLSFSFSVFPDIFYRREEKAFNMNEKLFSYERHRIERKEKNLEKQRIYRIKAIEGYIENLQQNHLIEKTRVESYERLFEAGRIPEITLEMEKVTAEKVYLMLLDSRFQLLAVDSSGY